MLLRCLLLCLPFWATLLALAPSALAASPAELATRTQELMDQGDYAQARQFAKGLVAELSQDLGPQASPTAAARVLLATVDEGLGDYAAIPESLGQALQVLARRRGPMLAIGEMLMATHHQWRGDAARAEELLVAATGHAGGDPRLELSALRRRGELALALGDFERAEEMCVTQAGRRMTGLDRDDIERTKAMVCWADALVRKGTVKTARKLYIDAVSTTQQRFGPEHPETARATLKLAAYHVETGAPKKGERLHRRALDLLTKRLGKDNRFVIEATAALAETLHHSGHDDRAAPLYESAVAMARRGLGPSDPLTAAQVAAAAHFAWCGKKDDAAALELATEALALRRKALGNDHRLVGDDLAILAERRRARGDRAGARKALAESHDILDRDAATLLATGSEGQKRVNAGRLRRLTEKAIDLHLSATSDDAEAAKVALTALLRRKGVILDAMASMDKRDPGQRRVVAELRSLVSSAVISRARRGEGREVNDQGWFESFRYFELRRAEAAAAGQASAKLFSVGDVAGALVDGQALIELVTYRPEDLTKERGKRRGEARYAAYVLHHDGRIAWTSLGPAAAIDALVQTTRRQIQKKDPAALGSLRQLDEQVMRPVRPLLDGAREVFLSPDGLLHLVPFQALRDEQSNFLIESMAIVVLGSGRDLLDTDHRLPSRQPPLIVAAPSYQGSVDVEGDSRAATDLRKMKFPPLKGTAQEAEAIGGLLKDAQVLTGDEATETAVQSVMGPRILHIATHGYFLEGNTASVAGTRTLVLEDEPADGAAHPERPPVAIEDPLLRSGLALRGANVVPPRPKTLGGVPDDGLLTAMEAASLDLRGTKLVVLSACETGVGEVHNGEGVIGLPRAFALAGAETLIMSLWKVSDGATRDLMIDTFQRLSRGEGRAEALRQAQLAALAKPGREHPYYWGAFFVAGDPTTLDGKRVEPRHPKAMPSYDTPGAVDPSSRGCQCRHAPSPATPLPASLLLFAVGLVARRLSEKRS